MGVWRVDPRNAGEIFANDGIKIVKDLGKESEKKLKVHELTPREILEILEWSILESWRAKFNLAGYVSTEFTKECFRMECEAIEQNQLKHSNKNNNSAIGGKNVTHKKSHGVKHRSVTQKTTLPQNSTVPSTVRIQLIPGTSVSLLKTVLRKPKELQALA
jgi:hypothetical protein